MAIKSNSYMTGNTPSFSTGEELISSCLYSRMSLLFEDYTTPTLSVLVFLRPFMTFSVSHFSLTLSVGLHLSGIRRGYVHQ